MSEMIAKCGLDCAKCPTFIATKANDDAAREKVAAIWSKMFGRTITAAEINCEGCNMTDGALFGHCKTCAVRLSAIDKGVDNCALCDEYACRKLESLLAMLPNKEGAKNLERIRAER